jgi:transposase
LVDQSETRLLDIHGVGVLVAATILSEVGNPRRYATKDKFAMANGTAPIEASSGRVVRHRLNRGGNHQLNRAIHTAALTQIARPDSEGRRYYQKFKTRGKTHREATRVLKRRISDRIWTHLQPPKPAQILT